MSVLSNFPSNNIDKHASQHAKDGIDPLTPSLIGAPANYINTLNGDITLLDEALTPGHYSFLDLNGYFGISGGLYDIQVSRTYYGSAVAYAQLAIQTYPVPSTKVFFRVYYYAGGWSNWSKIYSDLNKPTPDELDALGKDSGYIGRIGISVLNDYKESGIWNFEVTQDNPFGVGEGVLFTLVVDASKFNGTNPSVVQTITGTHSNGQNKQFRRCYYTTVGWSDWKLVVTPDYALNRAGDTMAGFLNIKVKDTTAQLIQWDAFASLRNSSEIDSIYAEIRIPTADSGGGPYYIVRKAADQSEIYNTILHTGNVTAGTSDITAGSSALADGCIYQMYE